MSDLNPSYGSMIERLEALAFQIENEDAAEGQRLRRVIRAYARILAVREPEQFEPSRLEYGDEEGYYDTSYPPKMRYADATGPRLFRIESQSWAEVATTRGFFYEWCAASADVGLFVGRDGTFYGATTRGTGKFGSFAARPGNHDVRLSFKFFVFDLTEIPIERLRLAERALGLLAFPHLAKMGASA